MQVNHSLTHTRTRTFTRIHDFQLKHSSLNFYRALCCMSGCRLLFSIQQHSTFLFRLSMVLLEVLTFFFLFSFLLSFYSIRSFFLSYHLSRIWIKKNTKKMMKKESSDTHTHTRIHSFGVRIHSQTYVLRIKKQKKTVASNKEPTIKCSCKPFGLVWFCLVRSLFFGFWFSQIAVDASFWSHTGKHRMNSTIVWFTLISFSLSLSRSRSFISFSFHEISNQIFIFVLYVFDIFCLSFCGVCMYSCALQMMILLRLVNVCFGVVVAW